MLILFLGSPRSALIAAATIPFALVAVFILMHLTNMPANLFSLGAIDFGIIVDGAIVVTEAILRRREADPDRSLERAGRARHDDLQVARPIFFATLIIITAYLPLFAFERAEAKLFLPMAYTVGYALFGALLCTFTLIPGLAYMAFRKPRRVFHNRPLEVASGRLSASALDRMLDRAEHRLSSLGGAALVAVVVLGVTTGREFLPELDEGRPVAAGATALRPLARQGERDGRTICGAPCANSPKSPTPSPSSAATTTAPIRGRLPTSKRRSG